MGSRRLPSLLLLAFGLLAVTLALSWSVGQLDETARANPQVSPDDDPSWGPVDAPVTIVEFSDYQCPFCKRFYDETLPQIQATYEGRLRFVYRDFPLTAIHTDAQKAAEASECADDQGRFWEYHALLWANQQELDVASLKAYAGELGLDTATFDDCLDSGKNTQEVQKDYSDGISYGVTGTPWFFINGQQLPGAQPFSEFQTMIDGFLGVAPTPSPTATPEPTPAPRGQLYNCPPANRWSIAVWEGLEDTPTGEALATCGQGAVSAAYSLDPETQGWWRYFPDHLDISNMGALDDMQGVIALGSGTAAPAEVTPVGGSDFQLHNCPQPGKWAISAWDGLHSTAPGQAFATCSTSVAAAYALDLPTQAWMRYVDGRPDLTSLTTLDNMQGVLALGEQVGVTSGVEGQVLLGPMCPVVQVGSPCPDQPIQATIIIWNAERTTKIRILRTDEQGRFRVPLVPGEYYLDPQPAEPGQPFPTPIPQIITVPPNQFVPITVEYDTGIR